MTCNQLGGACEKRVSR